MAAASRITVKDLSKVAVFAALIAVLGLPGAISIGSGAPITAQTLGVMLAGAVLGSWRGAAAVVLFEILVAFGFPLLSGARGGLGVFASPSAGFLIGWIIGAFVIGLIAHKANTKPNLVKVVVGLVLGGIGVVYALGIPAMAFALHLSLVAAATISVAYIPGDLIKIILATVVVAGLWRAYPKAFSN